jgi:alpha-L-glutamate ligase-like protein
MAVSKKILGMNARNFLYVRPFNRPSQVRVANDKLQTKERLIKKGIPTTGLIKVFKDVGEVRSFDWTALPKSFVIKPAHGYGGEGIMVVRSWDGETGKVSQGGRVDILKIEALLFSILDGAYSLDKTSDTVIIEERVIQNPMFKRLGGTGVSDIRVIVAQGIPVMAMVRMPTEYSEGKANLHLGAVGLGIDMRSGVTTHGIYFGQDIQYFPGTRIKVRGIKLPDWDELLIVAIRAQKVSKLGYVGIDIVLDKKRGPLVLEVNARPGLSIQIANKDSLRTRLERIDGVVTATPEQGVEIAKNLFANQRLVQRVGSDKTLGIIEKVTVIGAKKRKTVLAKIDTGAYRTAIDISLLEELGIDKYDRVVKVRAGSHGRVQKRGTAFAKIKIRNKTLKTLVAYNDRNHMRYPVIIGRRNLKGFLIDPSQTTTQTTKREVEKIPPTKEHAEESEEQE